MNSSVNPYEAWVSSLSMSVHVGGPYIIKIAYPYLTAERKTGKLKMYLVSQRYHFARMIYKDVPEGPTYDDASLGIRFHEVPSSPYGHFVFEYDRCKHETGLIAIAERIGSGDRKSYIEIDPKLLTAKKDELIQLSRLA